MKICVSRAMSIIVCAFPLYMFNFLVCYAQQPSHGERIDNTVTFYMLGKHSTEIEKIFGTPEKRLNLLQHKSALDKGEKSEKELWEYTSRGITFEFHDDKLARINAEKGFQGEAEGIRIGDTERAIVSKKGTPDGKPSASRWTYKKGHESKGWTIYVDFDDTGKVEKICMLANPHKKHNETSFKGGKKEKSISGKK